MKDKMKGLLIGMTIGTMLSGTAALAAGTHIEVAFRNLKYMFDGAEKVPAGEKGFIYEGSTYVPIRFVSEALGKPVEWDEATETIWIGNNPTKMIAVYQGGSVTKSQLDTFVAIQKFFNPNAIENADNPDYLKTVVKQLIGNRILAARMADQDRDAAAKKAAAAFEGWKQRNADQLKRDIDAQKLSQNELVQFLTETNLVEQAILSSISDADLKAKYDAHLAADKDVYTIASVRHILVGFNDQNGAQLRTKEEALKRAQEVQSKLKNKEDFAALAKQYSDDPGSKDKGGLYADAPVGNWVPEFKKAAVEQAVGTIGEPVLTSYGYHIIQVESRSTQTLEEVTNELKSELFNDRLNAFTNKELPGLIQSIELEPK